MSFTNGQRQVATEKHLATKWGGYPAATYFRCRMCGHRFEVGDGWRCVYTNNLEGKYACNPIVCDACDGEDVIQRWMALCDEAGQERFWWFTFSHSGD